jgi:hypothetical protein
MPENCGKLALRSNSCYFSTCELRKNWLREGDRSAKKGSKTSLRQKLLRMRHNLGLNPLADFYDFAVQFRSHLNLIISSFSDSSPFYTGAKHE